MSHTTMPPGSVIIEWVDERLRPAKSREWLWLVGGAGLALFILALVWRNFLFAFIIALAVGTILGSSRRERAGSRYALSKNGIIIDGQLYPYDNLHSFSLLERHNNHWHLKVRTGRTFLPFLLIPLGEEEFASAVRETLLDFLEEARHDETLVETLSDLLE